MNKYFPVFLLLLLLHHLSFFPFSFAQEKKKVFELMDLQLHITMSHGYSFFEQSLKDGHQKKIQKLTNRSMFKNVIYKNLLSNNSGARIFVNGALVYEYAKNKKKIRDNILEQIQAINTFAQENSSDFVVATSPMEVRELVHHTNKTVIIHSIEGATRLIDTQEDADFWAKQGVAFMTLIHLVDNDYGAAAVKKGVVGLLLNPGGALKSRRKKAQRGLTEKGKRAIRYLAKAGIMTDLSHMAPAAVDQTIAILKKLQLPPLVTHRPFYSVQGEDLSLTKQQLKDIYDLGGLYSLPISGESNLPVNADKDYLAFIDGKKICEGSLDSYLWAFNYVENYLLQGRNYDELTEEEKINLSLGWQSDFNGWVTQSRPRFGKKGCFPISQHSASAPLPIEVKGLAHPGMLADHWRLLEAEGMNINSLKFSTEKFVRMWERFQEWNMKLE